MQNLFCRFKFTVFKYGLITSVSLKEFKMSKLLFPESELAIDLTNCKNKVIETKILIMASYEETFCSSKELIMIMIKNSKGTERPYVTLGQ